jgi:hypothetical protein
LAHLRWSADFVAREHSLRLEISEYSDADRWRWRLVDAQGAFLADHGVVLDRNEPKYQALFNLPAYLWQHSAPDRRDQDERRLMSEVGAWIGETVLGRDLGEKILRRATRRSPFGWSCREPPSGSSSCRSRSPTCAENR